MSTTPTLISVLNQSSKLADGDIAAAMPAIGKFLAQDFAPVYGATPAIEFCPAGTVPSGDCPAFIVDAVPEAPGAVGYHDLDRDGSVTGVVGRSYLKVALLDGYAWTVTLTHELCELILDAPANRWRDAADGDDYAEEACDAVENDTYELDGVEVSNFVYPAFFNPYAQADDKLDHLGKLSAPFSMSPGGYQIKRTEPGQISQVFARHEAAGHDILEVVPSHRSKNGRSILLVFGAEYPEAKKAGKVAKAIRKYSR